jgi:hypothetical protein
MVAEYPGAALATFLIAWGDEHGKLPSEMWDLYVAHKHDFMLISTYRNWKAEREEEMQKKAEEDAKKRAR